MIHIRYNSRLVQDSMRNCWVFDQVIISYGLVKVKNGAMQMDRFLISGTGKELRFCRGLNRTDLCLLFLGHGGFLYQSTGRVLRQIDGSDGWTETIALLRPWEELVIIGSGKKYQYSYDGWRIIATCK